MACVGSYFYYTEGLFLDTILKLWLVHIEGPKDKISKLRCQSVKIVFNLSKQHRSRLPDKSVY